MVEECYGGVRSRACWVVGVASYWVVVTKVPVVPHARSFMLGAADENRGTGGIHGREAR